MTSPLNQRPLNVLVAGGGVAGVEALLALRDLAGDRVDLTLLAPQADFVYRPMAVTEPFALGHAQHTPLRDICRDTRARLIRGSVARVDDARRMVVTEDGDELHFGALVLAVGARTEPALRHATTWSPDGDPEILGGLLRDLEQGYASSVAFVVPPDVAWPLAAYELAMMTARQAWGMGLDDVDVVLVTAEDAPLGHFGTRASEAVRKELEAAGVRIETGTWISPAQGEHGVLLLEPGDRRLAVDHVVAVPRAVGPAIAGVASGLGFTKTDDHGKVWDAEHVWAAGDGTWFPIKHGGLATEQADVVAESLAALAGADIDPKPFRPLLRGLLLTGETGGEWMRHAATGGAGEGEVAEHALWWPPGKIAGRYLSPYLAARESPDPAGRTHATKPAHLDLERELQPRPEPEQESGG